MNLVFVRLVKFKKSIEECESFRDKLLYSLCHAHEMESMPEQFAGKVFDRLFEIARISNFSIEERAEYEASRMNMLDYNASMKFARKEGVAMGITIGREEGVAIGETRGVEKGIAIGRTEGITEVLDLLAKGYSLEQVKETLKG